MPGREGDVEEHIIKSLEEGGVFVDVDANVGYYTLLASKKVGPKDKVISIEPIPSTLKVLTRSISTNGLTNVMITPKASWNTSTKLHICIARRWHGLASIFRVKEDGDEVITVESIALDEVLDEHPNIKLMKVDVEGAEYQVLEGARRTLKKTSHVIPEASMNKRKIARLLEEMGFKVRILRFMTYIIVCQDHE